METERPAPKKVRFKFSLDDIREGSYNSVERLVDRAHCYDIFWQAEGDRDGMNSGNKDNLACDGLLELVHELSGYGDNIDIHAKTERLGRVRCEDVKPVHVDERRAIYNPEKLLEGLPGEWHAHNIIITRDSKLVLGNHHHDYDEAFFVPLEEARFALADSTEPRNPIVYHLAYGKRIYIPTDIEHAVRCKENSLLMGYGTAPFDPKRLIASTDEVKETLKQALGL